MIPSLFCLGAKVRIVGKISRRLEVPRIASHTPLRITTKDVGLTTDSKFPCLARLIDELSSMPKMGNEQQIMQDHASKGMIKVRSVGTATKPNSFCAIPL